MSGILHTNPQIYSNEICIVSISTLMKYALFSISTQMEYALFSMLKSKFLKKPIRRKTDVPIKDQSSKSLHFLGRCAPGHGAHAHVIGAVFGAGRNGPWPKERVDTQGCAVEGIHSGCICGRPGRVFARHGRKRNTARPDRVTTRISDIQT